MINHGVRKTYKDVEHSKANMNDDCIRRTEMLRIGNTSAVYTRELHKDGDNGNTEVTAVKPR